MNINNPNINEQIYARYLRLKFWLKNPMCKYCGVETILVDDDVVEKGKPVPPNIATIDHKYSKYNPLRHTEKQEYILCCNLCNNYRAKLEESKIPIEELRMRSQQHRRHRRHKPRQSSNDQTIEEIK